MKIQDLGLIAAGALMLISGSKKTTTVNAPPGNEVVISPSRTAQEVASQSAQTQVNKPPIAGAANYAADAVNAAWAAKRNTLLINQMSKGLAEALTKDPTGASLTAAQQREYYSLRAQIQAQTSAQQKIDTSKAQELAKSGIDPGKAGQIAVASSEFGAVKATVQKALDIFNRVTGKNVQIKSGSSSSRRTTGTTTTKPADQKGQVVIKHADGSYSTQKM